MERMRSAESYIRKGHSIKDQDCRDYASFTGAWRITRWDHSRVNLDEVWCWHPVLRSLETLDLLNKFAVDHEDTRADTPAARSRVQPDAPCQ